jgi:selT/selW/selH-like putative selenoprotein
VRLAEEVLDRWAPVLGGVELKTGSHGRFEVSIDGQLLFSKERLDRFPNKGEVANLLSARLGKPPEWRATQ